ncbi:MAG: cadherin-like domain-containing protein [Bacteriovoracaceae bacterium]|nr:cadherin-like domain-containing protein [Bacteriovoracaceae bacterium]
MFLVLILFNSCIEKSKFETQFHPGVDSNQAPTAFADSATTGEEGVVVIDVLANDRDPESETLTIVSGYSENGTMTTDGLTLNFTPNDSFTGVAELSYEIRDSRGATSTSIVSITVVSYCTYYTQISALPFSSDFPVTADGTSTKPYRLCTKAQIDTAATTVATQAAYLKIMTDIDVDNAGPNNNMFGEVANFSGNFNGNSKSISNFKYVDTAEIDVGFIAILGTGGVVTDVNLVGVNIDGKEDVGGLVGQTNTGTTINGSAVSGTVAASNIAGTTDVGGLVGDNKADISNSSTSATVTTDVVYNNVGGLVGLNRAGSITNCFSTGDVIGGAYVGGLIGQQTNSAITIENVYTTGNITALDLGVGGVVGYMSGTSPTLKHCRSMGNITQTINKNTSGGILGYMNGFLYDCYAYGDVYRDSDTGIYHGGAIGSAQTDTQTISRIMAFGNVGADRYKGGLIGEKKGTVSYSFATGAIYGSANNQAGGIVGIHSSGNTSEVYSLGTIRGSGNVGGVTAQLKGGSILSNCFNKGNIYTTSSTTGGISAKTVDTATISSCEAHGHIGSDVLGDVGGMVGAVDGTANVIEYSASYSNVTGSIDVGGIVGEVVAADAVTMDQLLYSGVLTGGSQGGGISNNAGGPNTYTDIFWDGDLNAGLTDANDVFSSGDEVEIVRQTTTNLKDSTTFTAAGWDVSSTGKWVMPQNGGYPRVRGVYHCYGNALLDATVSSYSGTRIDPVKICTASQMAIVSTDTSYWSKWISIEDNIDLSSVTITSMGTSSIPFSGTIEGKGHTLSNLTINSPTSDYVAFVGYLKGDISGDGSGDGMIIGLKLNNPTISGANFVAAVVGHNILGIVTHVRVTGGTVAGTQYVGGVAGYNQSYIKNISAQTTSITGVTDTGGIVGYNASVFQIGWSTASVTGVTNTGGVAGVNVGTMENSYSKAATVSGTTNTGGGVGYNTGTLSDMYSSGTIPGFLGDNNGGTVSNCFYDSDDATSVSDGGSATTTANMRTQATFNPGGNWKFNVYWFMPAGMEPALVNEE